MLQTYYRALTCTYDVSEDGIIGGMVATFTGNKTIGICRPGQMPIGFFMEDYPSENDFVSATTDFSKASIVVGIGDYITDTFEKGPYKVNDLLYCNKEGMITNNTIYRGNPIVGIVNSVENGYIGFISLFDNLESASMPESEKKIMKKSKAKNKFNRYTALSRRQK